MQPLKITYLPGYIATWAKAQNVEPRQKVECKVL